MKRIKFTPASEVHFDPKAWVDVPGPPLFINAGLIIPAGKGGEKVYIKLTKKTADLEVSAEEYLDTAQLRRNDGQLIINVVSGLFSVL